MLNTALQNEKYCISQNVYYVAAPLLALLLSLSGCGAYNSALHPQSIALTVTPQSAAIAIGQTVQFQASGYGSGVTWSVATDSDSDGPGDIDAVGTYTAPTGSRSGTITVTATSMANPNTSATATVHVVAPGVVSSTNNVQVASYTISPATAANVSVQFGLDTNYGLTTWQQPTPAGGGAVSLFVAGMKQSTLYHMRGVVQFADGSTFNDADQTFTTGTVAATAIPTITTTTTAGMTPQPGVELLDLLTIPPSTTKLPLVVTDLEGNVIWGYSPANATGLIADPIKLLPNGHFLFNLNAGSDGLNSVMQEVDLGGNVIWTMTAAQLNTALAAATCAECNATVIGTHHDLQVLANGHLLVLVSLQKTLSDGTSPSGDMIVDLGDMENVGGNNPNHTPQPVWAWSEFNHLDTNRRPYSYPDWTHSNGLIYSKDDGNLIISIRHQNWLVKVDYNNGMGTGNILWKMGAVLPTDSGQNVADFQLLNADGTPDTNKHDWFFAQHDPSFTTTNTSGKFGLVLFDNGDDRGVVDVAGGTCNVSGQPACFSTVPVFMIDETAKTAQFVIHPTTPDYAFFGGSAGVLQNGNVEFDECASVALPNNAAAISEITQTATPQTVWHMSITGQFAYRGIRLPSLYPGVQW